MSEHDDGDPEAARFFAYAAQGAYLLYRCAGCGAWNEPARLACNACGSLELRESPSAGQGVLIASSTVHKAFDRAQQDELPYRLGVARLDEGPILIGRIEIADGCRIGARVAIGFACVNGKMLPQIAAAKA